MSDPEQGESKAGASSFRGPNVPALIRDISEHNAHPSISISSTLMAPASPTSTKAITASSIPPPLAENGSGSSAASESESAIIPPIIGPSASLDLDSLSPPLTSPTSQKHVALDVSPEVLRDDANGLPSLELSSLPPASAAVESDEKNDQKSDAPNASASGGGGGGGGGGGAPPPNPPVSQELHDRRHSASINVVIPVTVEPPIISVPTVSVSGAPAPAPAPAIPRQRGASTGSAPTPVSGGSESGALMTPSVGAPAKFPSPAPSYHLPLNAPVLASLDIPATPICYPRPEANLTPAALSVAPHRFSRGTHANSSAVSSSSTTTATTGSRTSHGVQYKFTGGHCLNQLSHDMLHSVFLYVSVMELIANCTRVNRAWNAVVNRKSLWSGTGGVLRNTAYFVTPARSSGSGGLKNHMEWIRLLHPNGPVHAYPSPQLAALEGAFDEKKQTTDASAPALGAHSKAAITTTTTTAATTTTTPAGVPIDRLNYGEAALYYSRRTMLQNIQTAFSSPLPTIEQMNQWNTHDTVKRILENPNKTGEPDSKDAAFVDPDLLSGGTGTGMSGNPVKPKVSVPPGTDWNRRIRGRGKSFIREIEGAMRDRSNKLKHWEKNRRQYMADTFDCV